MKIFVAIILCFQMSFLASQNSERVEVNGQIVVEGNELEGITLYNRGNGKAAITSVNGKFKIEVKENDTLEVRALKYLDFNLRINKTTIESKSLKIYLIEEINELEEIIIKENPFTGDLKTDLEEVKTFSPKLDAMYFSMNPTFNPNESSSAFARDQSLISNATGQYNSMVNGLNVINIVDQLLLPLFRAEVKDKEEKGIPEVEMRAVKYYFGSEFLYDNFKIPKHRIEEFIGFVEDDETFDFSLLNYGRELEFLELLNKKSQLFLNQNKPLQN